MITKNHNSSVCLAALVQAFGARLVRLQAAKVWLVDQRARRADRRQRRRMRCFFAAVLDPQEQAAARAAAQRVAEARRAAAVRWAAQ